METTPLLSPLLYLGYHGPLHHSRLHKASELDVSNWAPSKLPKAAETNFWGPPEGNFQIDDLLDFPIEDDVLSPSCGDAGHTLEAHSSHGQNHKNFAEKLKEEEEKAATLEPSSGLCIPPDELADQLEWLSAFNEDSSYTGDTKLASLVISGGLSGCTETPKKAHKVRDKFHSPSPVSVLEQGGHLYANSYALSRVPRPKRLRKARTGGRVWSLDILKPTLVENRLKGAHENTTLFRTCSSDSEPLCSSLQQEGSEGPCKKAKKAGSNYSTVDSSLTRRCSHCLVEKTPQWRAGPMGPKTLCNACGVRYKSGRLVPEYRPAGSPSFVSEVHSNSHRRILEMRRAKEMEAEVEGHMDKLERLEEIHEEDCHSQSESCIVHPICEENLVVLACKEMPLYGENPLCEEDSLCKEVAICGDDPLCKEVAICGEDPFCGEDPLCKEVAICGEDPLCEEGPVCKEVDLCGEDPLCEEEDPSGKEVPFGGGQTLCELDAFAKRRPCVKRA